MEEPAEEARFAGGASGDEERERRGGPLSPRAERAFLSTRGLVRLPRPRLAGRIVRLPAGGYAAAAA
eukprot:CAMPEP_0185426838 /NCGR_PEP_ID=MMETSP1365-20130426/14997_1 /TAXON_ID=38817 /ORGANISM="Gephyrocapsa oceanica, Strain RCC1303" /LENGTH=66 /DNA_ID=CAMNT_0028030919 /DNA_START=63 /DNA_END=259 /DNA_ORIENTATION=-